MTPNAGNGIIKPNQVCTVVNLLAMQFDKSKGEWCVDDTNDIIYMHQFSRCQSTLDASDREISIQAGLAINRRGDAFNYGYDDGNVSNTRSPTELVMQRPWLPLAIGVGELPLFRAQLAELLRVLVYDGVFSETHGQLACQHFVASPTRGLSTKTLAAAVLDRAKLHARSARKLTPFGDDVCSWREVEVRCGTINVAYAAQPAARGLVWQFSRTEPCEGRKRNLAGTPAAPALGAELRAAAERKGKPVGEAKDGDMLRLTREEWELLAERASFDVGERCDLQEGEYVHIVDAGSGKGGYYAAVGPFGPPEMSPGSPLRALELFCGRAGWSSQMATKAGDHTWFLDRDRGAVEPSFAATPDALCQNGLSEEFFIHLDLIDFAIAVISEDVDLGVIHAMHDGFDCTTFTYMAKAIHGRDADNAMCGGTRLCYETNLRHHYLYALHLFQQARGEHQLLVTSMENPQAGRQYHPLTLRLAEQPQYLGGLGMLKVVVHYCKLLNGLHKPTNLWLRSPSNSLVREFVDEQGRMKYICSDGGPCHHYHKHKHTRPEAGDEARKDRGSIYPTELCFKLKDPTVRELEHLRRLNRDAASGQDGNRHECEVCDNRHSDCSRQVDCCNSCPRVYHRQCIPQSVPKPRDGQPWHCMHPDCPSSRCG